VPVITQRVQLYDGYTVFSAVSAAVDIDEDRKTFVLSKIDAAGNRVETVFNVPMSELVVRGQATRLRLLVNGVRKMIDFSIGASLTQGFGIAGEIAGGVLNSKSGVAPVIAALRQGGAEVHYWSYGKRLAVTWAIALGFVVVIVVIVVAAAASQG